MALLSDLKGILQDLSEAHPQFLVGALCGESEATVGEWIVHVKDDGHEILLKLTEAENRDRSQAMSVEALHQSLLALSCEDDTEVELCHCESELFRFDSPIAGAYVNYDEEALVFLDWDQTQRRQSGEGS